MATPLVSVVMPVYNARAFVEAAVRSVLAQSFTDFELIAVDDGSTDDSLAVLGRLASEDRRVSVVSRPNTGIVGALNDGLAAARGEFIARMDADDVSLPQRFAEQVRFLREHPAVVAVGSWVQEIDCYGSPLATRMSPCDHAAIDAAHLRGHGGQIAHPSVMIRSEALRQVGVYRPALQWAEDLDLFLRLAEVGPLANLPSVLLHYRQHRGNVCFTRQVQQREAIRLAVAEATARRSGTGTFELTESPVGTMAQRVRSWALHAIRCGNLAAARRHALALIRAAPWRIDSWQVMYWSLKG